MKSQNATLRKETQESPLAALIQELLREPYAVVQELSDTNLEGLGKLLEDAAEELERPDLPPDLAEHAKSYARCKDVYCRILMQLEQENLSTLPDRLLGELAGEVAPLPTAEVELSSEIEIVETIESLNEDTKTDITLTDVGARSERAPRKASLLEEFEAIVTPSTPVVEELTAPKEETRQEAEDAEEKDESTTQWDVEAEPLLSTAEKAEEKAVAPRAELQNVVAPSAELQNEVPAETPVERKLRLAPKPPAAEEPEAEEIEPALPATGRGKVYAVLAQYLSSLKDKDAFPVPAPYAERLIAQSQCFAVELVCCERLEQPIERFWAQRGELIQNVWSNDAGKPGLAASLKRAFDELMAIHGDWLSSEKRFPHAAVVHSLRYILAYESETPFRPALLDAATLILLFGQERTYGKVALKNALGLHGLSNGQVSELAFRLLEMQRLRNQALWVASDPAEGISDLKARIEAQATTVLSLLNQLEPSGEAVAPGAELQNEEK